MNFLFMRGPNTVDITNALHLFTESYSVFIIADTFNRVVFVPQGYTIGLGEQLMKNIRGL